MNYLTTKLLTQEEIEALIKKLDREKSLWEDGKNTAGSHASIVKNNLQFNRESELSKKLSHSIRKKILAESKLIENEVSNTLTKLMHYEINLISSHD